METFNFTFQGKPLKEIEKNLDEIVSQAKSRGTLPLVARYADEWNAVGITLEVAEVS